MDKDCKSNDVIIAVTTTYFCDYLQGLRFLYNSFRWQEPGIDWFWCLLQSDSFQEFFEGNSSWLKPYAVFCFLRDLFGTAEHWKWGKFSRPDEDEVER